MAWKWMTTIMASLIFVAIGTGILSGVIKLPLQDYFEEVLGPPQDGITEAQAQYRRGERRRGEGRRRRGPGFGITIDLGKIFSGPEKKKRKAKKRRRKKPEKKRARRKPEKKRKEWKVIVGIPELPIMKFAAVTSVAGWKKEYEGVCDTWGRAVIVKVGSEGKYCIWTGGDEGCDKKKNQSRKLGMVGCTCNPGFDARTYPDCKPIGWKDPVQEARKPSPARQKLKPVPSLGLPGILPAPGRPIEKSEREKAVIGAKPIHRKRFPEPPPPLPPVPGGPWYCLDARKWEELVYSKEVWYLNDPFYRNEILGLIDKIRTFADLAALPVTGGVGVALRRGKFGGVAQKVYRLRKRPMGKFNPKRLKKHAELRQKLWESILPGGIKEKIGSLVESEISDTIEEKIGSLVESEISDTIELGIIRKAYRIVGQTPGKVIPLLEECRPETRRRKVYGSRFDEIFGTDWIR